MRASKRRLASTRQFAHRAIKGYEETFYVGLRCYQPSVTDLFVQGEDVE